MIPIPERVTVSMVNYIEVLRKSRFHSNCYQCKVVLNDGRQIERRIQAAFLHSIKNIIGGDQNHIKTVLDREALYLDWSEQSVYGSFVKTETDGLTELFQSKEDCCTLL